MKILLIMRHAKSDRAAGSADDFHRPLAHRGHTDLPLMAQLLRSSNLIPELIISSPATRARETAEGMAAGLKVADRLRFDERLYLAGPPTLTAVVSEQPKPVQSILVIAHNPGLEEWLHRLCGCQARLPTAGLAVLQVELEDWAGLSTAPAQLEWFVLPRLVRAMRE